VIILHQSVSIIVKIRANFLSQRNVSSAHCESIVVDFVNHQHRMKKTVPAYATFDYRPPPFFEQLIVLDFKLFSISSSRYLQALTMLYKYMYIN
jgi:hypothetical protein